MEEDYNLLDALKTGIDLEKESIDLYSDAQKKIKEKDGKEMLEFLLREEKKHLELLTNEAKSLEESGKLSLDGLSRISLFKLKKKEVLPNKNEFNKKNYESRTEFQILQKGIEIEQKGIKFFNGLIEKTKDEETKKFFERLRQEEVKHLRLLNMEMDSIAHMGEWAYLQECITEE